MSSPRIVKGQVWHWQRDDEVVLLTLRVAVEPTGETVPVQFKVGALWGKILSIRRSQFGTRYRLKEDAKGSP